jgi:DNA-binding response OmpR family regulator
MTCLADDEAAEQRLIIRLNRLEARMRDLEEHNADLGFVIKEMTTAPKSQNLLPEDVLRSLTVLEARLLSALVHANKQGMTTEGLLSAVYYDRPPKGWPELKIINVFVCKIRNKLRKLNCGIQIETIWGQGYRIVLPVVEEPVEA